MNFKAVVVVSKSPILSPIIEEIKSPQTINDVFDSFTGISREHTKAYLNGVVVEDWDVMLEDGDSLALAQTPQGTEFIAAMVVSTLISAAIGYYLFRPEGLGDPDANEKARRVTGDRNQIKGYEPLPFILGKRKVVPAHATKPFFTYVGDDQWYHMLLHVGDGPLKIHEVKIGDVSIDAFEDKNYAVVDWYENTNTDSLRRIWSTSVNQNSPFVEVPRTNYNIDAASGIYQWDHVWVNETIPAGRGDVGVTVGYPNGLYRVGNNGDRRATEGAFKLSYQDETGRWLTLVQYMVITPQQSGMVGGQAFKRSAGGPLLAPTVGIQPAGQFAPAIARPRWGGNHTENNNNSFEIPSAAIVYDTGLVAVQDDPYITGVGWAIIDEDGWNTNNPNARMNLATVTSWSSSARESEFRVNLNLPFDVLRNFDSSLMADNQAVQIRLTNIRPIPSDRVVDTTQLYLTQRSSEMSNEEFFDAIGRPEGDYRPVILALRIKASDQVSGNLDSVNVIAESVVPVDYNEDWRTWFTNNLPMQVSNNPADMYKWVLQGPFNPVRVANSKIDLPTLLDWKVSCDEQGWETSDLVNYEISFKECLNNVANTGRAEFYINDGRFSVLEYTKRTIPTQVFTPKNSSNFISERNYPPTSDGIQVEFQNEEVDWELDEWDYFDPEISPTQRTGRMEKMELWGVSNPALVQRHARFAYLERRYRREVFSLDTDIEGLVCRRGDMVKVNNDIIKVGIGSGFVREVSGLSVRLDETFGLTPTQSYGFELRATSGIITVVEATYNGGGWWTLPEPMDVQRNDLVSYGSIGSQSLECIVTEILYRDDYQCSIKLVNAANFIYDLDDDELPPYDTGIGIPDRNRRPLPPTITASQKAFDLGPATMEVIVDRVGEISVGGYELFYRFEVDDSGFEGYLNRQWVSAGYQVSSNNTWNIQVPEVEGDIYMQVRAKAFGVGNLVSDWSFIYSFPISLNPAPPAEIAFVKELVDTPKTQDGTRSTIRVSLTPPRTSEWGQRAFTYEYSVVDYRRVGEMTWYTFGQVGAIQSHIADIEVQADGTTYEIRARSVNNVGYVSITGPTTTFRVSNIENPQPGENDTPIGEILPVPDVTGLELFGQGNSNIFAGRDAKFVWRKASQRDSVEFGSEGERGAGASRRDQYQEDYVVEMWAGGTLLRTEYTPVPSYTYTYEQNVSDYEFFNGVFGAYRTFEIRVWVRGRDNQLSRRAARLGVTNPAPALPTDVDITALFSSISISYTEPSDLDFAGVNVWVKDEPFDPELEEEDFFYTGSSIIIGGLSGGQTYYVVIQPVDDFGPEGSPYSQVYEVQTLASIQPEDLSGWAYQIDPADREFIEENLANDAIPSQKIENLTAAKLTAGVINATETITAEGLVRSVAPSVTDVQVEAGIGPYEKNPGKVNLIWAYNGNTEIFAVDENGNASFTGTINVTGGNVDYTYVGGVKPPANANNTKAALEAGTVMGAGVLFLNGTDARIHIGPNSSQAIFGSQGIQMQYNSGNPRFHVGTSTSATNPQYIQFNTNTGEMTLAVDRIGFNAVKGLNSVAFGTNSNAAGFSVSVGVNANARGTSCVAVGNGSQTGLSGGSPIQAVAVGTQSQAASDNSLALGYDAVAGSAVGATAISAGSRATGANSIAIGRAATASGLSSVAIGTNASSSSNTTIRMGAHSGWSVDIPGTLNAGTKNFKIEDPTDRTKWTIHSCYEGPVEGGTIYRYEVSTKDGRADIELPTYFSGLNKDVMVFCQADRHFGRAFGEVDGNTCTITSDMDGAYFVVIYGTRNDTTAIQNWCGDSVDKTKEEIADEYYSQEMERGRDNYVVERECEMVKELSNEEILDLYQEGYFHYE